MSGFAGEVLKVTRFYDCKKFGKKGVKAEDITEQYIDERAERRG